MRKTTLIALPLALVFTAALFGGIYLIVAIVLPAISAGRWQGLARWGGAAILAGIVVYRVIHRVRGRKTRTKRTPD